LTTLILMLETQHVGRVLIMARIAIIDRKKCTKEKCGYRCLKVCPGVRMGDDTVTIDADGYPVISEVLCTGCGICPKKCPVDAIKIINLAEEIGKPAYQYGVNSFRLYGMPLPQDGVAGFIGRNGIGKSTALRLLSGAIKPNFAETAELSDPEILKRLRIQERHYFEKIFSRDSKVSYKPQSVDRIPQAFDGMAGELLKKTDERGMLEKYVKAFGLGAAMDKKLSELSGGELQRVAIAAACMKNADIYYFDEPASYLDIEQRLAAGRAIKELAAEKKVIVVEHDLALFDYLCDSVYVFFGEENAFGRVSGLKASRNGINEYLEGYLKEENIRFRDHAVFFDIGGGGDRKSQKLLDYPEMSKTFDKFSFHSEAGSISKGEVIGVLGRNATGKSLFVKMLAGVLPADSGDAKVQLKVSYKPQYVNYEGNEKVGEIFMKSGLNGLVFEECKRKLGIAGLLEKKASEISGGEMQRVAITLALSQEADIYLFDEPSAYLDIEQRLHFASLLRSVIQSSDKAAFVVDHDVLLVDAISNRLMVFAGDAGVKGTATAPLGKKDGMNGFLKMLGITLRRDKDSKRPRINKPDSALDREQKEAGNYYYQM